MEIYVWHLIQVPPLPVPIFGQAYSQQVESQALEPSLLQSLCSHSKQHWGERAGKVITLGQDSSYIKETVETVSSVHSHSLLCVAQHCIFMAWSAGELKVWGPVLRGKDQEPQVLASVPYFATNLHASLCFSFSNGLSHPVSSTWYSALRLPEVIGLP